jgi:hypothetical protein
VNILCSRINLIQLVTRQMDDCIAHSQGAHLVNFAGIEGAGRRTRPTAYCCGLEMAWRVHSDADQSAEQILGTLADSANTVDPVEHRFDSIARSLPDQSIAERNQSWLQRPMVSN